MLTAALTNATLSSMGTCPLMHLDHLASVLGGGCRVSGEDVNVVWGAEDAAEAPAVSRDEQSLCSSPELIPVPALERSFYHIQDLRYW